MTLRFTIIDRDNVSHIIDEPVGWDAIIISINRDLDKHGIVTDYQENDFEFFGLAFQLIKAEYDAYGVEGIMTLVIEEACSDDYEELYRGRIVFADSPSFSCGPNCSVRIPVATTSDVIDLINKWDQKVNLLTDTAFDETTVLPAYAGLGYDLPLPSKGILLQNKSENAAAVRTEVLGVVDPAFGGYGAGMIEIPMKQLIAEIGGYYTDENIGYSDIFLNETGNFDAIHYSDRTWLNTNVISPIVNYSADFPGWRQVNDVIDTHISFSGTITNLLPDLSSGVGLDGIRIFFLRLPGGKKGTAFSDYDVISDQDVYTTDGSTPLKTSIAFTFTYDNTAFVLNENDRLYLTISISHQKHFTQYEHNAFSIEFNSGGYFRMKTLSHTTSTTTKAFMINEAISRITEAITNNKIKAYSEYFGRTDSEPYAVDVDGCGSLESITKGLFIRRQENRNGNTAVIALSMQDVWEGIDPIHHIGFGIEPDTNRDGFLRLRVEHWKHFYNDTVILTCSDVGSIKRNVIEKEHYSIFGFGYEKWEAEEYNGLDEFLTKRNFRTTLSQVKNTFSKISKFVSSGYAWEITRRKGDIDSKDWRFDNDTFIVCNKRREAGSEDILIYFDYGLEFRTDIESALLYEGSVINVTGSTLNDGTYTITNKFYDGVQYYYTVSPGTVFEDPITVTVDVEAAIIVETGNITSPEHIIDPDTIYNWRIRPVYNAMRWIDKIFAGYRTAAAGNKIIFTDGEGNYFAKGEMTSETCKLESGAIAENDTIDASKFADAAVAQPFLRPERVVFEYPMSLSDFKLIQANPYGLIAFNNDCEAGEGWTDTIKYKASQGLAEFSLIPQYE